MPRTLALMAITALTGCTTGSSSASYQICDLSATVEPVEASVGETVVATGRPFSDTYDTQVTVGGLAAPVLDVARTDCFECDACRIIADCDDCSACLTCAESCESCVETTTFTVPSGTSGTQPVVITNRFGTSSGITLSILASEPEDDDTGTPDDTGSEDDTGSTGDTGDTDDTGSDTDSDTGASDTGS